ncbi:efflux transporter outer membrane subunit [Zoogloea sp.]|uniref:efflux transporter outer membrane subunit n=1 Tax=Zoogloea sp. TaxID=49181 RepID=UPI0035B38BFA
MKPQPATACRRPTLIAMLVCAATLSGCAAFPDRATRPEMHTLADYASQQSLAGTGCEWPMEAWWLAYGDAQLSALIDEALAGAPNLAVALARQRQAEAQAQVATAATRPQLSANGSAQQQKQSYNYLTPRQATPQGWQDYGRATLDFSWELDFWGKNRAGLAAATSEAEAARAEAAQTRMVLAASIASAYAEFARLYAALDTAQAALVVRSRTTELFQQRQVHGLETRGGVRQVESRRSTAEADVLALQEQLTLQRHRLAALAGAGPDRGRALQRPRLDLAHAYTLPANLAADLLGRRPDIAAARLRAQAAARRIDQAETAFYPNVNLLGFVGLQSLGLNLLTAGGSSIGSLGAAISLPIFDGGRLRGELKGADAAYAEAVGSYDGTVVQALQEVADAAASQQALGGQLAHTDAAVDAAREAWRIQNNRYEGGLATYLDVLSAEDSLLATLRTQSDLRARGFALDVALVRALGGGYAPI